jgi:hypothetical protein
MKIIEYIFKLLQAYLSTDQRRLTAKPVKTKSIIGLGLILEKVVSTVTVLLT